MMRRSTIKALETRRDEVITERKQQGKMRTLGASNPHNNNKDKHRDGRRRKSIWLDQVVPHKLGLEKGTHLTADLRCIQCHVVDVTLDAPKISRQFFPAELLHH